MEKPGKQNSPVSKMLCVRTIVGMMNSRENQNSKFFKLWFYDQLECSLNIPFYLARVLSPCKCPLKYSYPLLIFSSLGESCLALSTALSCSDVSVLSLFLKCYGSMSNQFVFVRSFLFLSSTFQSKNVRAFPFLTSLKVHKILGVSGIFFVLREFIFNLLI